MTASALTILRRTYSIPLLLIIWQIAATSGLVTSRLLPPPSLVLSVFWSEVTNGPLLHHAGTTLYRALTGFALGASVGLVLAVAMARLPVVGRLLEPLVFLGYPVPKIALFPIFIFIFGVGSSSKIAFTFLECLYPVIITTYLGMRAINTRLIWTARNFGAGRLMILRRVVLPAVLPSIFAGLRMALPLAITVVVVTEMIGDSAGLGYYINIAGTRFRFAYVYAGILMVGIIGLTLDTGLMLLRRRLIHWKPEEGAI
ncbi:MAG: ABC transporter permease [Beijerinckiaceae bacterium]|nr:ABC transporter permease [Beijerinckiaceae bacterium]